MNTMKHCDKEIGKQALAGLILFVMLQVPGICRADTATYTYDTGNRLSRATYGGGRAITYTYDDHGNVLSVATTSAALAPVVQVSGAIVGVVGSAITDYQVTTNRPGDVTGYSVKGLPAGLKMNTGIVPNSDGKGAGVIYGTPAAGGSFQISIAANSKSAKGIPSLLAVQIANPFTELADHFALAGPFNGLLDASSIPGAGLGGSVSITVTTGGAFSGSLLIGAARYAFSGHFDGATGDAPVILISRAAPLAPLTLTLHLAISGPDRGAITGTVSCAGSTAAVDLFRQVYGKSNTAFPFSWGSGVVYNVALGLSGHAGDNTYPQGFGFVTVKVDAMGKASAVGKLADGTAFSAGSYVWPDGTVPIYAALYTSKGAITGELVITPGAVPSSDNSVSGSLAWTRLAAGGNLYAAGFSEVVTAGGGIYSVPAAGYRVLDLGNGATHPAVTLTLSSGGPATSIVSTLTISTANKVTLFSPNTNTLSMRFTTKTGMFTGKVTVASPTRKTAFQGILLPSIGGASAQGLGFFLLPGATPSDPTLSGWVSIER